MITGAARLDLSREGDDEADRRALLDLAGTPDGARVIVDVGGRRAITTREVDLLCQASARLHIEIQGTPAAVGCWVGALRRSA